MPTKSKLWPMDGHTEGKHLVLRAYLDAWFGLLSNKFKKLLFVDGFSGPGEYSTGEEGSPLIALNSVIQHSHSELGNIDVEYIFIELDPKRLAHLKKKIANTLTPTPNNLKITYIEANFEDAIAETVMPALKLFDGNPCFVMADPFGVGQTPMKSFEALMKYDRVELYISMMYEFINRFKTQKEFEEPLNKLFGDKSWKKFSAIEDKEHRKKSLYKCYRMSLKEKCNAQVIHFDLCNGNRLKYAIFFATGHTLGSHKMKAAIWKVIPNGKFSFKSEKDPQMEINMESPNFEPLQRELVEFIKGKGEIPIKDIMDYIASDATDFHPGQVKSQGLKVIEKGEFEILTVQRTLDKKRRAFTYPDDCLIKIA